MAFTFLAAAACLAVPAAGAQPATHASPRAQPPNAFQSHMADVDGLAMHYVVGGSGSPVVLLHGFPEDWTVWRPQMTALAQHHTVIAVDLRGAGASGIPKAGYDFYTMARDVHDLLAKLGLADGVDVVGHDVGMSVAFAYGEQYRSEVNRLVAIEAPVPDDGIYKAPALARQAGEASVWHFGLFQEPLAQQLIAGREVTFVRGFMRPFIGVPGSISASDFRYYGGLIARPGRLLAWLKVYRSLRADARLTKQFARRGKLAFPVLAVGGQRSFGPEVAAQWSKYSSDVRRVVIPKSGHWVPEERPQALTSLLTTFLGRPPSATERPRFP